MHNLQKQIRFDYLFFFTKYIAYEDSEYYFYGTFI